MRSKCHITLAIVLGTRAVIAQKASDTALGAQLPPQLLPLIPLCAQSCTSAAVAAGFTKILCSPDDLKCLCLCLGCSDAVRTFEELAIACLCQKPCTRFDRANAILIYSICSRLRGIAPSTDQSVIVVSNIDSTSSASSSRSPRRSRVVTNKNAIPKRSSIKRSIEPNTAADLSAASSSASAVPILQTVDSTPLSEAQVAGIAIASIALVVLTVGMTGCLLFFRKRRQLIQQQKNKETFYTHHQSSGTRQVLPWHPIDPRGGNGGVGIQPLPRSPTAVTPPPPIYDRRWPRYYGVSPEEDIGIARTVDVPIVMAASPVAVKFHPDDIRPPAVPGKTAEGGTHRMVPFGMAHSPEKIADPFRTPERKIDAPSLTDLSPDSYPAFVPKSRSADPASSHQETQRTSTLRIDIPAFGLDISDPIAFADPRPAPPRPKQPLSMVISPEIRALINRSRQVNAESDDRAAHTTRIGEFASSDRQQQRPRLEILRQQRAGPLAKLEEAREARVARKAEQALQSESSSGVPSSDVLPAGAMRDELQASPVEQHVRFSRPSVRGRDREFRASLTSFDSSGSSSCYDDEVEMEKSIETTLEGQSPISNLRYPEIPRSVSPRQVPYLNAPPRLLFTLDEMSPIDRAYGAGKAIEDQLWRTEPSPIGRRPVQYTVYHPTPQVPGSVHDATSNASRSQSRRDQPVEDPDAGSVSRRHNASIIYQMPQLTPTRKGDDLFLSVS